MYRALACCLALVGCTSSDQPEHTQQEPVIQHQGISISQEIKDKRKSRGKCNPNVFENVKNNLPEKVENWGPVAELWCGQMLACGIMEKEQMNECIILFLKSAKDAAK